MSPVIDAVAFLDGKRLLRIVGPPSDGGLTRDLFETYNARDNADAAFLIVECDEAARVNTGRVETRSARPLEGPVMPPQARRGRSLECRFANPRSQSMLDVHPPHEPVHGWRGFAVHLLTITAGLLIALGLEAMVEAVHHHELANEARENIEHEVELNSEHAKANVAKVQAAIESIDANLTAARKHRDDPTQPFHGRIDASWTDFEEAAWLTARESGALAHMPLDEVQHYAGVYARQQELEREALAVMGDLGQNIAPLMIEDSADHATPEDLRTMMLRSADTKVRLLTLRQYVQGLENNYADLHKDAATDAATPASGAIVAPAASTTPSAAASAPDKH